MNTNGAAKCKLLEKITERYKERSIKSKETLVLVDRVLAKSTKEKLNDVLSKFRIYDSAPRSHEYFNLLKEKHGKCVLSGKREVFINSLLGYLVTPKDSGSSGWVVTYEDFSQQVEALTSQFSSGTRIFPKKCLENEPSIEEIAGKSTHLFVRKIEEIKYEEVKKKKAKEI